MAKPAAICAAIALASVVSPAPAAFGSADVILRRLLGEREPGKPVECLSLHSVRSSRIIDGTAVIFEAGDTLYLNRPASGAELLNSNKAILTRSDGRICSGEAVQVFDAASGVPSGSVFLGRFVPYRKSPYQMAPYQAPSSGY